MGTCCTLPWAIGVTAEEAPRFGGSVIYTTELGEHFVGKLAKAPGGACVYHGPDGCSVYWKRPGVCVRYKEGPGCGYFPDPLKQLGLIGLVDHHEQDDQPSGGG